MASVRRDLDETMRRRLPIDLWRCLPRENRMSTGTNNILRINEHVSEQIHSSLSE